ncbi:MAG: ABC transporter permease, partial [Saprospiraceae bacterium]
MLLNYFLLAARNIARQRGYAIVNTLGLSIGLASAIFIFLYVRDEMTFDTHLPEARHTYRMGMRIHQANGESNAFPAIPAGWDNYIKDNYPGVEHIAGYNAEGMPTTLDYAAKDKKVLTEDIIWAEPAMTNILAVEVVNGARENPLKEVNSILMSESAAREMFGDEDPINKTLAVSHTWTT